MNEIYTTQTCPWCQRAKVLLDKQGIEYAEIDVTTDRAKQVEMVQRSGRKSMPQIFIDGEHVGGFDDLVGWLEQSAA